jgi:hypothetical protein
VDSKTRHPTILPPLQPLERLKRLPKAQRKDAKPMLESSLNPSGR